MKIIITTHHLKFQSIKVKHIIDDNLGYGK